MPNDWARRFGQRTSASGRATSGRLAESNPFTAPASPPSTTTGGNPFAPVATPGSNPFEDFTSGAPNAAWSSQAVPTPDRIDHASSSAVEGPGRPRRPLAIHVAYVALLVAAFFTTVLAGLGIYALTELRQTVNNVLDVDPTGVATLYVTDYADDTQLYLSATLVITGILLSIGYVVVARAIRKGRRWPRLMCPVLAVMSLPALFLGHIAALIVVAGLVATVAAWTPGARRYSASWQHG